MIKDVKMHQHLNGKLWTLTIGWKHEQERFFSREEPFYGAGGSGDVFHSEFDGLQTRDELDLAMRELINRAVEDGWMFDLGQTIDKHLEEYEALVKPTHTPVDYKLEEVVEYCFRCSMRLHHPKPETPPNQSWQRVIFYCPFCGLQVTDFSVGFEDAEDEEFWNENGIVGIFGDEPPPDEERTLTSLERERIGLEERDEQKRRG